VSAAAAAERSGSLKRQALAAERALSETFRPAAACLAQIRTGKRSIKTGGELVVRGSIHSEASGPYARDTAALGVL
jgi:septum formation inhibitor MinC